MTRLFIYGLTGVLSGLIFGFAFFGAAGAVIGTIVGAVIGGSVSGYMNRNKILDRAFFAQQDVDRIMNIVPYRIAGWGLSQETKDRITSAIRSTLQGWL